jgi:hypothetical protein
VLNHLIPFLTYLVRAPWILIHEGLFEADHLFSSISMLCLLFKELSNDGRSGQIKIFEPFRHPQKDVSLLQTCLGECACRMGGDNQAYLFVAQ